jgi:hypothetical protein
MLTSAVCGCADPAWAMRAVLPSASAMLGAIELLQSEGRKYQQRCQLTGAPAGPQLRDDLSACSRQPPSIPPVTICWASSRTGWCWSGYDSFFPNVADRKRALGTGSTRNTRDDENSCQRSAMAVSGGVGSFLFEAPAGRGFALMLPVSAIDFRS